MARTGLAAAVVPYFAAGMTKTTGVETWPRSVGEQGTRATVSAAACDDGKGASENGDVEAVVWEVYVVDGGAGATVVVVAVDSSWG